MSAVNNCTVFVKDKVQQFLLLNLYTLSVLVLSAIEQSPHPAGLMAWSTANSLIYDL